MLKSFAIAWLILALQPCAMALGLEGHHCPHCPPSAEPPCEARIETDCSWNDGLTLEPRGVTLKLKDTPGELPVVILPALPTIERPLSRSVMLVTEQLLPAVAGPPLNILYCVYLQ